VPITQMPITPERVLKACGAERPTTYEGAEQ
jgi:hypothetical protein